MSRGGFCVEFDEYLDSVDDSETLWCDDCNAGFFNKHAHKNMDKTCARGHSEALKMLEDDLDTVLDWSSRELGETGGSGDDVLELMDAYASFLPGNSCEESARKSGCAENIQELLTCSLCYYISPSHTALNLHLASSHNKCPLCKIMFETSAELQDHFSKSKVHKFCQSCNLKFACNELLEEHRKNVHPPEKVDGSSRNGKKSDISRSSYICDYCTKSLNSFDTLEKLESHLQREHIRCFPCKRNFSDKSSLLKHLEMQSSHNFCKLCDTDFVSVDALRTHALACRSKSRYAPFPKKIETIWNESNKDVAPDLRQADSGDPARQVRQDQLENTSEQHTDQLEDAVSQLQRDLSNDAPPQLQQDQSDSDESQWETDNGEDEDNDKTVRLSVYNDEACVGASKGFSGTPHGKCLASISSTQVKESRFACLVCGEKSYTGTTLKKHLAAAHNKCLRCKIKFDSASSLHHHFSTSKVHALKFCGICEADFSSKECSIAHFSAVHPTESTDGFVAADFPESRSKESTSTSGFSCELCSKSLAWFETEEKLEDHIQAVHIRCFPCKRNFTQEKALQEHLVASSQHNYCCHCDTDFLSVKSFNKHVEGCSKAQKKVSDLRKDSSAYSFQRIEAAMTRDRLQKAVDAYLRHYSTSFSHFDQDSDEDEEADYDEEDDDDLFEDENDEDLDSEDDFDLRCHICLEEFDSKVDRDYHEYDNHLCCLKCTRQCASRRAFIEHHLTTKGHNICFECDENFLLKESYEKHRKCIPHKMEGNTPVTMSDANVKKKRFVCDDCDEDSIFETEDEFQKHLDTNHWVCFPCDNEYKSKKALIQHWKQSNRHNFCHECEMDLETKEDLKIHIESGRHCD